MKARLSPGSVNWPLRTAFVALGLAGVGSQTYLAREYLIALAGDESCIGVGLATWLGGIALGAGLARRLRCVAAEHLASCCFGLLVPSGLLAILVARGARRLAHLDSGELVGLGTSWLLSVGVFLLPGILVGCAFVALAARAASQECLSARGIGQLYVFESLGSLGAGALITWLLLAWTSTYVGYSLLLMSSSLLWLSAARRGWVTGYWLLLIGTAALATFSLTPLSQRLEASSQRLRFESQLPHARLLDWAETHYEHLALSDGETHALFASGTYAFSFPDPFEDESQAHSLMLLNQAPRRVLLLGGFEPGLLQHILRHPVERLDWVSLDGAAHAFTFQHLDSASRRAFSDPRVHSWFEDPRRWLNASRASFDLVLLLQREPTSLLLSRNATLEFARLVRTRLTPNGSFVSRFASGPNVQVGQKALMGASLYRTLGQAFPFVRAAPEPVNVLVAGWTPEAVTLDSSALERRWKARHVSSDVVFPETLQATFPSERIATLNAELGLSTRAVAPNTDDRPIAFAHALAVRQQLAQAQSFGYLARTLEYPALLAALALLPSILVLSCTALLRPRRRTAVATVHATCVIGAAGMALSVMLLFSFQTYVGALYSELGLLSGVFMLGLAIGGALGMRGSSMLVAELASIGACSLALVFWAAASSLHVSGALAATAHAALLLLTGAATGMAFPIAASGLLALGAGARSTAAWIEAADHVGAAFAALITAVILVPVFGLKGTAALLLVLQAMAFLVSLLSQFRSEPCARA